MEPLRRQSETARIYLKKKEELKIMILICFNGYDSVERTDRNCSAIFDDANRELTEAKEKQEALKLDL